MFHTFVSIRIKAIVLTLLPVLALIFMGCSGVIYPSFSHQGKLLDSSGNPVANGTYTVVYKLYHAATGGTAVYTESNSVTVTDGYFDSDFGASNVDPKIFSEQTWLEISVNGETLTPRQLLRGAPYASGLVAGSAAVGPEPITYTYSTYDNLGSAFFAANTDSSVTGGSGLTAITTALIPSGSANKADVAAVRGLAKSDGTFGTGAYGGIFVSEGYRGIYAEGHDNYYAGYFESSAGIYVQGSCTGCALALIAKNIDENIIAPGDFVATVGVEVDPDYGLPILLVRKATAGDNIVGVAERAMTRNEYDEGALTRVGYEKATGLAQPEGYVSIITEGLVQAHLSQKPTLETGTFITISGTEAIPTLNIDESIAQVMSESDESGLQWILLNR